MGEDHRVQQADAARQPGGREIGRGVQNVAGEKQQAQAGLGNSKPAKEPVGDEGVAEESASQAVDPGEGGEFSHDHLGLRRDSRRPLRFRRVSSGGRARRYFGGG